MEMKIKYKYILFVTVIMFIYTSVLSSYYIFYEKTQQERRLKNKIESNSRVISKSIEDEMWNFDYEGLTKELTNFFEDKDIARIYIKDKSHEFELKRDVSTSDSLSKIVNIKRNGYTIGTLEISYTNDNIKSNIIKNMRQTLIFPAIMFFGIIFGIYIVSIFILSPFKKIINGLEIITDKKFGYRLDINSNDEFGTISKYFNKMSETIEKEIDFRKKTELDLKKAILNAQEANKAKSQFLANMSHEIRTPMNGVIGMIDVLNMTKLSEEQKKYLEAISFSADNLLKIINDILDLSKIENGKVDLDETEINLEEFVNKIGDNFALSAHKKGLELVNFIERDVPKFIFADKGKIQQVIYNFVSNAIKFTEEGEVFFKVQKVMQENDRVRLRFAVEDTGIGISKGKIKEILKPFVQGDISYTKKYQGTGLGLAISKKITELLGGDFYFESEEGRGSKFCFEVNVQQIDKKYEIKRKKLDRNLRILVIDENRLNRDIVKKMLEMEKMDLDFSKSGFEGLETLEKNQDYDLILLDVNMPGMDGIEFIDHLAKLMPIKSTPIVMFTSVDIRDKLDNLKLLGIRGYIMKPIKKKELIEKIHEITGSEAEDETKDIEKIQQRSKTEKNILIVEDNEMNKKTLEIMLEQKKYPTMTASNGKEGLEMYKNNKDNIGLIFMDIQMPVMNGYDSTIEIRKENKEIPIIAITAYGMTKDIEKIKKSGINDILVKPVKSKEIYKILEKYY